MSRFTACSRQFECQCPYFMSNWKTYCWKETKAKKQLISYNWL